MQNYPGQPQYAPQPQNNPQYYYPPQPQPVAIPPKEVVTNMRHQAALQVLPPKYGSSVLNPNLTFTNQDAGERVYLITRAHWITNLGWIIRNIFYILIPIIVFGVVVYFNFNVSFLGLRAYILIILIYYSIIITNIIKLFADWYFDPMIVTNVRILEYDFKPFANYHVAELNLENIDDIKESSEGLLGELFNYGNITVLSENSTSRIEFKKVPDSTKVRNIITDVANIAKTYRYGN